MKRTSSLLLPALAALALIAPAAYAQTTSAVTLSGGIVDSATTSEATSFVLGYTFTVSAPVSVTALGFYDDNNTAAVGTAMSAGHNVGIYSNATGTLLVQGFVSPTDAAYAAFNGLAATAAQSAKDGTGVQLFRYTTGLGDGTTSIASGGGAPAPAVSPVFVLLPGVTYTIAAVTGSDNYDYLPGSDFAGGTFGTAGVVTYGQDRYVDGSATVLQRPTLTSNNDFGPDGSGGEITGAAYFGPNFLYAPVAAPEPSQWAAFAVGLLGLGALCIKARRARA